MKKLMALCIVLLVLLPAQAFAHSKLIASSPEKNSTVDAPPAQISMEFNTDIATISTFTLENEQGDTLDVDQISVDGAKLTGVPVNQLENGNYSVKWTIVGADGHTVDGSYSFTVNAPEAVQEPVEEEQAEEPIASPEPSPTVEPSPAATPELDTAETTKAEEEKNSPIIPIVVIVLIIAIAAIFAAKRKKK